MAKLSGLGWTTVAVDDSGAAVNTITDDTTNVEVALTRAVQDSTGMDRSAMERILLLADCSITMNGIWNSSADKAHSTFKDLASTTVTRTVTLTHDSSTLAPECLLTAYTVTRAPTGELTWAVPAVLQSGTAPSWS